MDDTEDNTALEENEILRRTNRLYLTVILRYRDHIEKSEALYMPDLPRLIEPDNPSVAALAAGISSSFNGYDYNRDFIAAADKAFKYIKSNIHAISVPVQFWQKPNETLENRAGDVFDMSVLLCSVLIKLNCPGSRVVLAINDEKHVAVTADFDSKIIAYSFEKENGGSIEFSNIRQVKYWLHVESDAQAYAFNNINCMGL